MKWLKAWLSCWQTLTEFDLLTFNDRLKSDSKELIPEKPGSDKNYLSFLPGEWAELATEQGSVQTVRVLGRRRIPGRGAVPYPEAFATECDSCDLRP